MRKTLIALESFCSLQTNTVGRGDSATWKAFQSHQMETPDAVKQLLQVNQILHRGWLGVGSHLCLLSGQEEEPLPPFPFLAV